MKAAALFDLNLNQPASNSYTTQQQQQQRTNMADDVVDLTQDEPGLIRFHIDRPPLSKPSVRHGYGRGGKLRVFTDNAARREMIIVRGLAQEAKVRHGFVTVPRTTPVKLKVWCHLKRPDEDFVSRVRGVGRLKAAALSDQHSVVAIKPDVDNMAKLIMDALTGVFYEDDSQVVDLQMVKLRDNVGLCLGRVSVEVSQFRQSAAQMMPDF